MALRPRPTPLSNSPWSLIHSPSSRPYVLLHRTAESLDSLVLYLYSESGWLGDQASHSALTQGVGRALGRVGGSGHAVMGMPNPVLGEGAAALGV